MKNQYFGDVNDYLKYGLLRCCAEAGWNVGVCWMLTPDDTKSDGRKTAYLNDAENWRSHDPVLYDALGAAVIGGNRSVSAAEAAGIISGARYDADLVPDAIRARREWFQRARRVLAESDIIFFDPDNGLEVQSKPKGRKDSSKYIFWDEVEEAGSSGASVLIFQHFARENRKAHVARLSTELKARAPGATVTPFITSNVLFLLASTPRHADRTGATLDLVQARWGSRFRLQV